MALTNIQTMTGLLMEFTLDLVLLAMVVETIPNPRTCYTHIYLKAQT